MDIKVDEQLILNHDWLYKDGEVVGETQFIVSTEFAKGVYEEKYKENYATFEEFLDAYVPETEGREIYQQAKAEDKLIEYIGEKYYHKYLVLQKAEYTRDTQVLKAEPKVTIEDLEHFITSFEEPQLESGKVEWVNVQKNVVLGKVSECFTASDAIDFYVLKGFNTETLMAIEII